MLFDTFPREIGVPKRRTVWNKQDFLKLINLYNGKTKVFTTVYSFKNFRTVGKREYGSYETANVDKLFFDFDEDSCYNDTKKLHDYCDKHKLQHSIVFSGRGYHVYVFLKQIELRNPAEAIRGGQEFFVDKLKLNVDKQTLGNPAQLARVPNTYNVKRRRFCIPLMREQFEKGHEYIRDLALHQNHVTKIIMQPYKKFDIIKYDKEPSLNINNSNGFDEIAIAENFTTKDFPLCVKKIVKDINDMKNSFKERFYLILYLKEAGYLFTETLQILKQVLPEKKFYHCVKQEKQPHSIYGRSDLLFPNCDTLMRSGYCPRKCAKYDKLFYK